MASKRFQQFCDGLSLMASAREEDIPLVDATVRELFWSLDNTEQPLALFQLKQTLVNHAPWETEFHIEPLLRLLLEATKGDEIWEVIEATNYIVDTVFLESLINNNPGKFSESCLARMQVFFRNRMHNAILHQPSTHPLTSDEIRLLKGLAARNRFKRLVDIIYNVRLKNFLQESGPPLGASFEAEKAAFEQVAIAAGVKPEAMQAFDSAKNKITEPKELFSFKSAMDLVRAAYEAIITHITTHVDIEPASTGGATLRKLFDADLLSEHEYHLGHRLYKFVSDRGTHALDSKQREAKVSLFMTMEFSQYLLAKLTTSEKMGA